MCMLDNVEREREREREREKFLSSFMCWSVRVRGHGFVAFFFLLCFSDFWKSECLGGI